jgi:PAS domain S-box-containing protein
MQSPDPLEFSTLDQVIDYTPLTVPPQASVMEVITMMNQQRNDRGVGVGLHSPALLVHPDCSSTYALVIEAERLVGIFTERDIVRLTASATDLSQVTMAEVMTRSLITLRQSAGHDVLTVLSLLRQHRIRHLPILDDQKRLVGVITLASLQKVLQLATLLRIRHVADVMTPQVIHAPLTASVLQVAGLMVEHGISCVVIVAAAVDSGEAAVAPTAGLQPIGIITERDIVQVQLMDLNLAQTLAQAVMSTPLFPLHPRDSLWFAHQEMQRRHTRRLVVTGDQGELLGILTQTNLLQVVDPTEMSSVIDVLQHQVEERTRELQQINHHLQYEVIQRQQTEEALRLTQEDLERRVLERTADLSEANLRLQQEIADRKQVEAALRNSEHQLQSILDYSPAVIYLLDPNNRHLLVNRKYAELLATTPETIVGKRIYDVWPTSIADALAAHNRQVLEHNQLVQTEEVLPQPDGLHTYITLTFPLRDPSGAPYAVCGISTDITQRKQWEQQFYRAQRLESLGTLATGIAHDLNNVLTPILAIAQSLPLKLQILDADSQRLLQVLEDTTKRGIHLVSQILTFVRGGEGHRVPLQPADLVLEVVTILAQTLPKTIEIQTNIPETTLWTVAADPTQLHQVIINLCINARDAMPRGGILCLSAKNCCLDEADVRLNLEAHAGNYVVISVADTGTGIPPEQLDLIFDPFFTTKEPDQGTGLGLSTVLGIVKTHGGFIQVQSEQNKGTQFQVYLPA